MTLQEGIAQSRVSLPDAPFVFQDRTSAVMKILAVLISLRLLLE